MKSRPRSPSRSTPTKEPKVSDPAAPHAVSGHTGALEHGGDWVDLTARILPLLTILIPVLGGLSRVVSYAWDPRLGSTAALTAPLPDLVAPGVVAALLTLYSIAVPLYFGRRLIQRRLARRQLMAAWRERLGDHAAHLKNRSHQIGPDWSTDEAFQLDTEAHMAMHKQAEREIDATYPLYVRSARFTIATAIFVGASLLMIAVFILPAIVVPFLPLSGVLFWLLVSNIDPEHGVIRTRRLWAPVIGAALLNATVFGLAGGRAGIDVNSDRRGIN